MENERELNPNPSITREIACFYKSIVTKVLTALGVIGSNTTQFWVNASL